MAKKGDVPINFESKNQIDLLNEVLEKYIDKSRSLANTKNLEDILYTFYLNCVDDEIYIAVKSNSNTIEVELLHTVLGGLNRVKIQNINELPAAINRILLTRRQKNIDEIDDINSDIKMLLDTIDAYKKENNQIDNLLAGQN